MITKNVKLYLGDGYHPVQIPVSQFDTMWRFVFEVLYKNQTWAIPDGAEVVLNGRKPDGNVFAIGGTILDGKATVDCDIQMTAVAGAVVCELSILADSKTIGTANFTLDVEAAPKSPDDVSSESTLPAYGEILDRLEEIGRGSSVTVDDALSSDSENPVQNKVIKAALDGKIDDVQINSLSIVSAGIANIPKASASDFGVAKVYPYGDPPSRVVKLENSGSEVFSVPMLDANGHIRLAVLPEATTSAKGAMSASDKSKLDGIETEANKTTVDSALSTTSANPVQNSVVTNELNTKVSKPSSPAVGDVLAWDGSAWVASAPTGGSSGVLGVTQDSDGYLVLSPVSAVTEEEVADTGAVTAALDPNVLYHFTGAITSLTITLNAPQTGMIAHYHFDFESGATAATLTLPQTVVMPSSFSVEANKRYEVDILNNYGVAQSWAVSA